MNFNECGSQGDEVEARSRWVAAMSEWRATETLSTPVEVGGSTYVLSSDPSTTTRIQRQLGSAWETIWAADHSQLVLRWKPSRSGTHLALLLRDEGSMQMRIEVTHIDTARTVYSDPDASATSPLAWLPDWETLVFSDTPESGRRLVCVHVETGNRSEVYSQDSEHHYFALTEVLTGIVVTDYSPLAGETHLIFLKATENASRVESEWARAIDGNVLVSAVERDEAILVNSNGGSSINILNVNSGKFVRRVHLKLQNKHALLRGVKWTNLGGAHYLALVAQGGTSFLSLHSIDGSHISDIATASDGVVTDVSRGKGCTRFAFSSPLRPPVILELNGTTARAWSMSNYSRARVPALVVRQKAFRASDGAEVSLYILSQSGSPNGPPRPAVIYAYGGFGVSMTPNFAANDAAWVERGNVHVIACVRGGGEQGHTWHEGGKGEKKPRTILDVIEAAEYLIDAGWTSASQLGVVGASNGGMVVISAALQRPDLFGAAVSINGVLDMMNFEKLGGGSSWISEYGSIEDQATEKIVRSYSPVEIAQFCVTIPPTLLITSRQDSRVSPRHSERAYEVLNARGFPVWIWHRHGEHFVRSIDERNELDSHVLAFMEAQLRR